MCSFRRGLFCLQAEDGIRDKLVTGVQTCALPISWFDCSLPTSSAVFASGSESFTAVGDRKSVVWGKRVDLGGRRIIKKKKHIALRTLPQGRAIMPAAGLPHDTAHAL